MNQEEMVKKEESMKREMLEKFVQDFRKRSDQRKELTQNINGDKESVIALMQELKITDFMYKTDEHIINVYLVVKRTNKLNKKALAETLSVETSELDIPGVIRLTKSGELTQEVYREHIETVMKDDIKIKKAKRKDRKE